MKRQKLNLHKTISGALRCVIKNNHGRVIYLELSRGDEIFIVNDCFYIDRKRNDKYYAVPQKFTTKAFAVDKLLDVIEAMLDKKYYGIEIVYSNLNLETNEFIEKKLKEMKRGYKFLIFIGEGELTNGIPAVIRTRFKNRIHRSIYLEMQYRNGSGVITNCHYYDRIYKEKNR